MECVTISAHLVDIETVNHLKMEQSEVLHLMWNKLVKLGVNIKMSSFSNLLNHLYLVQDI